MNRISCSKLLDTATKYKLTPAIRERRTDMNQKEKEQVAQTKEILGDYLGTYVEAEGSVRQIVRDESPCNEFQDGVLWVTEEVLKALLEKQEDNPNKREAS